MLGQRLRQTLIEGHVLHVDHHGVHVFLGDAFGDHVGLFLWGQVAHADVTSPIGEDDEQGQYVGVQNLLTAEHIVGKLEPCGKGRLAAHRDIAQGFFGKLHRVSRRQDQQRAVLLEGDQTDPVAALVGIGKQREDGALCGGHSFGDCHRPRGIYQEQHQIGGAPYAHLALVIAALNGKSHIALFLQIGTALLEGCGGTEGCVEGNVILAAHSRARHDIAPALAVAVGA